MNRMLSGSEQPRKAASYPVNPVFHVGLFQNFVLFVLFVVKIEFRGAARRSSLLVSGKSSSEFSRTGIRQ